MNNKNEYIKKIYYFTLIAVSIVFLGIFVVFPSPLCTAVAIFSLGVLLWCGQRSSIVIPDFGSTKVPFILFGITFLTRFIYCFFMLPYIHQVSDFEIVLKEAQSGMFTDYFDYYRFYFHKFLYPFLLNKLALDSQVKIVYCQCFLVAFIPVVLYFIGKKIRNVKIGVIAAFVYILSPAQLVYVQVATEEHLAALVLVLLVLLLIVVYQKIIGLSFFSKEFIKVLILAFAIGELCFLSSYTKDWASVVLVAVFICSIYQFFKSTNVQRIALVLAFVIVFLTRSLSVEMIKEKGEEVLGVEPNNGVVVMHMFATLDPNSPGTYYPPLRDEYLQIAEEHDYDLEETNKEAFGILKERIKNDWEKMPALILKKGRDAYRTNSGIFVYALEKEVNEEVREHFSVLGKVLFKMDHVYYVFGVLCMLIAVWKNRNRYIFFIQLVILGGGLSSLLIESQDRYKYSILPLWGIPIAYAILFLLEDRKKRFTSNRKVGR